MDLLGLDASTLVTPTRTANSSTDAPSAIRRGEIVLAKYGNTAKFYWAKILKLVRDSSGAAMCDVVWLRPLAGTRVGKLYALHDGVDETLQGECLPLANVRRPTLAEVASDAPPGANAGRTPPLQVAATAKQEEVADLLGDPIATANSAATANPNADLFMLASTSKASQNLAGAAASPSLCQSSAAPHLQAPGYGFLVISAAPSPWLQQQQQRQQQPWIANFGDSQFPQAQQHLIGGANGLPYHQQSQGSSMHASAPKGQSFDMKIWTNNNTNTSFDFISDIMSGALTDVSTK